MSEIRKDFLIERYSIISEKRGQRPHHFKHTTEETKDLCFFCLGNEHLTPPTIDRFPKKGEWNIRVFRNKFPALKPPKGDHEVIVETNEHGKQLENLKPEEILEVFKMYETRRLALEKKFKYASIFRNSGKRAGASLPHSHSQILASDLIPPIIQQEMDAAKKKKSCPWCEYVKSDKKRIAGENKNVVAITANAPRFSYEVWLMPKKHVSNFSELSVVEALDFCTLLKKILLKLSTKIEPSYNYVVHHSPKKSKNFHFHLEILPRVANHAGYELGEGAYIIDTTPETAAKFYRS